MSAVTTFATSAMIDERAGWPANTESALVARLLNHVTWRIANYCGRVNGGLNLMLRQSSYTEYLTGDGGRVLKLGLWPVESITSVTIATDRDFDNGDVLTVDDEYQYEPDSGRFYRLDACWPETPRSIKVVYVGGYVDPGSSPTGSQIALPYDIIEACISQVVYEIRTRESQGVKFITHGDGQTAFYETGELLPSVKAALSRYRRVI